MCVLGGGGRGGRGVGGAGQGILFSHRLSAMLWSLQALLIGSFLLSLTWLFTICESDHN